MIVSVICFFLLFFDYTASAKSVDITDSNTGTNSWWVYPLSVTSHLNEDITYVSFTDEEGYSGLMEQNLATGESKKVRLIKTGIDDHNAGAVELMDDGRLLYAVTGHNRWGYILIYISTNPYDISSWEKAIRIPMEGTATYAQLIKTKNGYQLFTRQRIPKSQSPDKIENWSWLVSSSSNGRDWSDFRTVIDGGATQYYLKAMPCTNSSRIRMVMYSNPNKKKTDIRLGFYNPTDQMIENAGFEELDYAEVNGSGVPFTKFNIIVSQGLGGTKHLNRLLDVAITPAKTTKIAFASFNSANNSTYRVATYNSVTEETTYKKVVTSGRAFYTRSKYFGGMVFDESDPDALLISRKVGSKWRIESWTLRNGKFSKRSELYRSSKPTIRPFVSRYGVNIHFATGDYNPLSYNENKMQIMSDFFLQ